MAHSRDNHFTPSSPRSSNGVADSFKDTPDTRFSNFSPVDGSAKPTKLLQGIVHSSLTSPSVRHPVSGYHGSNPQHDRDPFVTSGQATRLSPTASSFQPFSNPSMLSATSSRCPVASALSVDLGLSRLLDLSSHSVSVFQVEHWLEDLNDQGIQFYGTRSIKAVTGHVYLQFTDIRDACSVHASCRLGRKDWTLEFVNQSSIIEECTPQPGDETTGSGQVFILAIIQPGALIDPIQALEIVKNVLYPHGQLFAFVKLSTFTDGSFKAVVEFCSNLAALAAVKSHVNNSVMEGVHIVLSHHRPSDSSDDLTGVFQSMSLASGPNDSNQQRAVLGAANLRCQQSTGFPCQPAFAMYPLMFQPPLAPSISYVLDRYPGTAQTNHMSPLSPSYTSLGSLYQSPPSPALTALNSQSPSRPVSNYSRSDARRQNAARISRSPHHNSTGHHNHVDIQRIREGIDVRTTIMLRNIPNKVDQAMLKRIVDESSWGKYDFMYLRIDFANDCNVGYAFINFVDPLDIIDFVEARGNQRWNCFKSDKVAEISYATIQGKDCLVQKFRNSSVMLEAPHYRPKLYFTSNGPMPELAGQEEPFPEPDNQSKMKRSCENAEHVGLFTPNAGQHFRDEQRRRRSQYDRGTRLAALEEYDYETSIHHRLYNATSQ